MVKGKSIDPRTSFSPYLYSVRDGIEALSRGFAGARGPMPLFLKILSRIFYFIIWLLLFPTLFSLTGGLFCFSAATLGMPLQDANLATIDHWMGYDWQTWHEWVLQSIFNAPLVFAYESFHSQFFLTIICFVIAGRKERLREFAALACWSLWVSIVIFAFLPTLGPEGPETDYAKVILSLRAHGLEFTGESGRGYIAFPSFHAALAVIYTYVHRGEGTFWYLVVLNSAMILATGPVGGHYLVDVLAGMLLAFMGIVLSQMSQDDRNDSRVQQRGLRRLHA